MLAELTLVQAVSAAGRAWDNALIQDGDGGPPGISWVEIDPTAAGFAFVRSLEARNVGRLVPGGQDQAWVYRIFAETLLHGPACRALGPQNAACHAFVARLTEAACLATVQAVPL